MQTTIERLPRLTDDGLKALAANALRMLSADDLAKLVEAIEAEQLGRKTAALAVKAATAKRVTKPVGSGPLADKIERAFRAMPPSPAELQRLTALNDHPGYSEEQLSELFGDEGPGGFSLVIGRMCQDRSSYLPAPSATPKRKLPFWSGVICTLTAQKGEDGRETHGWTLKPETVTAARRLGLLPPPPVVAAA